jgi:hypothetical protein
VMTATLDGVAVRKKDKPAPTAEQQVAEELVPSPGVGPVADRPGWAAEAADQDGAGDGVE